MPVYKCDSCGNCVCYSEPEKDWGAPRSCLYDVGFPVNWRKVLKTVRRCAPLNRQRNAMSLDVERKLFRRQHGLDEAGSLRENRNARR
jgi:hypothetical protein